MTLGVPTLVIITRSIYKITYFLMFETLFFILCLSAWKILKTKMNIFVLCSVFVSILSLFGTVDGASIVSRSTRQTATTQPQQAQYKIELLVIADESIHSFHGANQNAHVLNILTKASHYLSLLTPYGPTIPLVNLEGYGDALPGVHAPNHTIIQTLDAFHKWHLWHREVSSSPPMISTDQFDAVLLLTRKRFPGAGGVASVGTICTTGSYALVVDYEDVEFVSYAIAHELAHLMGMRHYDSEPCVEYYRSRGLPIPDSSPMYGWNSCDRHLVSKHLESKGKCLLETNVQYN